MTTDRDIVEEPGPYRDGLISALIERVRDANKGRTFYEGQDPWEYRDSLFAEEITALRAEVEHVNAANQSMLLVIEKQNRNATALRAEVELLHEHVKLRNQTDFHQLAEIEELRALIRRVGQTPLNTTQKVSDYHTAVEECARHFDD